MSDPAVQLKINGRLFGGWQTLRAEVGMEQCSGSFHLTVADRWAEQSEPWQIRDQDACELLLAGRTVITGYVDLVQPSFDRATHGIEVFGRDKTMDLIDCTVTLKSTQWKRAKLDRIARDICKPFGIDVIVETDLGAAFDSFQAEQGERAFETIDRAARMRGVLVMTDGIGHLVLTRASTVKTAVSLVQGVNVYSAEMRLSSKERYSEITVKGQGKGDATRYGDQVAHGTATVKDEAVTRYRPLTVIAEHHGLGTTLQQRAEWERNVRRGRSTRGTIRVSGWTVDGSDTGPLWRPNTLVPVQVPYLGVQEDLLIPRCVYTLGPRGSFTELELVHPSAFALLAGVKGTRLDRAIHGVNGLEDNRKHARARARRAQNGTVVDMQTGNMGDGK